MLDDECSTRDLNYKQHRFGTIYTTALKLNAAYFKITQSLLPILTAKNDWSDFENNRKGVWYTLYILAKRTKFW